VIFITPGALCFASIAESKLRKTPSSAADAESPLPPTILRSQSTQVTQLRAMLRRNPSRGARHLNPLLRLSRPRRHVRPPAARPPINPGNESPEATGNRDCHSPGRWTRDRAASFYFLRSGKQLDDSTATKNGPAATNVPPVARTVSPTANAPR